MTFAPHDLTTIHYYASLRDTKPNLAGRSIDNEINAVVGNYRDLEGRTKSVFRAMTHKLLDSYGITRTPSGPMSVDTTSSAAANQAYDTYLADKARPLGKGTFDLGQVWDQYGRLIPAHSVKPGRNIQIMGLNPDPDELATLGTSNVVNGLNVFRIIMCETNYPKTTIHTDSYPDRLDIMLARAGK
jgi:hypothetical protein